MLALDKPERLAGSLVTLLEAEWRRGVEAHGFFSLALTGGSVATAFFPRLAAAPIDWSRTEFFWGDERAVPVADPASNFGLARSLWLDPAAVPAERVHPMEGEEPDLERAAQAYSEEMLRVLGDPPRLDIALLGVGPDGHVCSLFPGHRALQESSAWTAVVPDSPKPPPRRLTLTLPTLAAAECVAIVALGKEKAAAVRAALAEPASDLPVARVARSARRLAVFLDADAASLLPRPLDAGRETSQDR
jgi:6-phosphogluconolactonase